MHDHESFIKGERSAERYFKPIIESQQRQIEYLEKKISMLIDPIVRAKMLEPSPPIFITSPAIGQQASTKRPEEGTT